MVYRYVGAKGLSVLSNNNPLVFGQKSHENVIFAKKSRLRRELIAPRLVSELASEGASGRLFSQTQINKNATRFGPIYHRHVHFNLIQTRIASCLFVWCLFVTKSPVTKLSRS